MTRLRSNVCDLDKHARDILLDIQVVGRHTRVLEIRIRGLHLKHGWTATGLAVRSCQVYVTREIYLRRKRRIVRKERNDVRYGLVKIETDSSSNRGLTLSEWFVRESNPRTKIRELPRVRPLEPAAAHGDDPVLLKIENAEPIVNLVRNAVVLPAQADIPRPSIVHLEIVLNECTERARTKTIGHGNSGLNGG